MARFPLALAGALLAAALFTACGDDEPAANPPAAAEAPGAAFPVTVEHKLGTATIAAEPRRVVALDFPSADAAIAVGVTPVAM